MYTIKVTIPFEYAHRLIHHEGKCRNVHGHSGKAIIEVGSDTLDANGFVIDFGIIKQPLTTFINEYWDHSFIINAADPLFPIIEELNLKACVLEFEPTAENMAKYLYGVVEALLPQNCIVISVEIQETCTGSATYHSGTYWTGLRDMARRETRAKSIFGAGDVKRMLDELTTATVVGSPYNDNE